MNLTQNRKNQVPQIKPEELVKTHPPVFNAFKCFMSEVSLKSVEWVNLFHNKQKRYNLKAMQLEYSHDFTNQTNLWHWC